MSYELQAGETYGDGMQRVCHREIERAIVWSQRPRNSKRSPIHQTRKHLKKARAALRLLSPVVGQKKFASAEKKLRKIAKLLSELRDAEVRFQTVSQLVETFDLEKDHVLDATETLLGFELESFLAASGEWQIDLPQRLSRVRSRIAKWDVAALDCKDLRCVVQQTYKTGVQSLNNALDQPTAENFHTLRKAAKELTYQLCLLAPVHPPFFGPLVDELKVLSEQLGDAHDLAFLGERLRKLGDIPGENPTSAAFFELIELREKELQLKASTHAEKFYGESVKDFSDDVSRHLNAWEVTQAAAISPANEVSPA